MANPFAAFSIQVGSAGITLAANNRVEGTPLVNPGVSQDHAVHALPLQKASLNSGKLMSLDELPQDWWHIAGGGYQRTVVRVLGKKWRACSTVVQGAEELVVGMLKHVKSLGIGTEDARFPIVRFERWVDAEFLPGIAAGSPVPLKGAAGKSVDSATEGPEIFVRCKVAAKGTSDWHDLAGRALDCESRQGLGFRRWLDYHMLDTLRVSLPRCEDYSRARKDGLCLFFQPVGFGRQRLF